MQHRFSITRNVCSRLIEWLRLRYRLRIVDFNRLPRSLLIHSPAAPLAPPPPLAPVRLPPAPSRHTGQQIVENIELQCTKAFELGNKSGMNLATPPQPPPSLALRRPSPAAAGGSAASTLVVDEARDNLASETQGPPHPGAGIPPPGTAEVGEAKG